MPGNVTELTNLKGLSAEEVNLRRNQYGKNIFQSGASRGFLHIVWDIVKEPMFILLVIACSLYFILGEISEGIMMLVAMTLVTTISLFQEMKIYVNLHDEKEWYNIQKKFLGNHTYFTDFGKLQREPLKQKHLDEINRILAA